MKKIIVFLMACVFFAHIDAQTVIYDYSNQSSINAGDKLLGTDSVTLKTKNFLVRELAEKMSSLAVDVTISTDSISVRSYASIADTINALPLFTVGNDVIKAYVVSLLDGSDVLVETSIALLKVGTGYYGLGGIPLSSTDFLLFQAGSGGGAGLESQLLIENTYGNISISPGDYQDDVNAAINTFLGNTVTTTGDQSVSGLKTFTGGSIALRDNAVDKILSYDEASDNLLLGDSVLIRQGNLTSDGSVAITRTATGLNLGVVSSSGTEASLLLAGNYPALSVTAGQYQSDFNLAVNNYVAGGGPSSVYETAVELLNTYPNLGVASGLSQYNFNAAVDAAVGNFDNNYVTLDTDQDFIYGSKYFRNLMQMDTVSIWGPASIRELQINPPFGAGLDTASITFPTSSYPGQITYAGDSYPYEFQFNRRINVDDRVVTPRVYADYIEITSDPAATGLTINSASASYEARIVLNGEGKATTLEGGAAGITIGNGVADDLLIGTKNIIAYTPTTDYNPATKKYVDDQLAALTLYDNNIETYYNLPNVGVTPGETQAAANASFDSAIGDHETRITTLETYPEDWDFTTLVTMAFRKENAQTVSMSFFYGPYDEADTWTLPGGYRPAYAQSVGTTVIGNVSGEPVPIVVQISTGGVITFVITGDVAIDSSFTVSFPLDAQ